MYPLSRQLTLIIFTLFICDCFLILLCIEFYATVCRLLNREICVFNAYCSTELNNTCLCNSSLLVTLMSRHTQLTRCAQHLNTTFSTFAGVLFIYLLPFETLLVYLIARTASVLTAVIAYGPLLLIGLYFLFKLTHEPARIYDNVGVWILLLALFADKTYT